MSSAKLIVQTSLVLTCHPNYCHNYFAALETPARRAPYNFIHFNSLNIPSIGKPVVTCTIPPNSSGGADWFNSVHDTGVPITSNRLLYIDNEYSMGVARSELGRVVDSRNGISLAMELGCCARCLTYHLRSRYRCVVL